MVELAQKKCEPCEGKTAAFNKEEAQSYLKETPGWQIDAAGKLIFKEYKTKNFLTAVEFIKKIAVIAEEENHHPDVHLTGYRNLKVEISTHAIGGLSENDFILAAKINQLPVELKK